MYKWTMHLKDYMDLKGLKDEVVAARIKRSRPTVSRIRRGLVQPSWKTIKLLEKFSGGKVTANDFAECGNY